MLGYEEARNKLNEIKDSIALAEKMEIIEPYIGEYIKHLRSLETAYEKELTKAVGRELLPTPKPERSAIKWDNYFEKRKDKQNGYLIPVR